MNDSTVCIELFAVYKLIVELFNTCTIHVIKVRKPETHFSWEFATEWIFQKNLLLAHVKLNLIYCYGTVWTRFRIQYLISFMFAILNSLSLCHFPEITVFSRKYSCSSSCLICVQLFFQGSFPTRPRLYLKSSVALA